MMNIFKSLCVSFTPLRLFRTFSNKPQLDELISLKKTQLDALVKNRSFHLLKNVKYSESIYPTFGLDLDPYLRWVEKLPTNVIFDYFLQCGKCNESNIILDSLSPHLYSKKNAFPKVEYSFDYLASIIKQDNNKKLMTIINSDIYKNTTKHVSGKFDDGCFYSSNYNKTIYTIPGLALLLFNQGRISLLNFSTCIRSFSDSSDSFILWKCIWLNDLHAFRVCSVALEDSKFDIHSPIDIDGNKLTILEILIEKRMIDFLLVAKNHSWTNPILHDLFTDIIKKSNLSNDDKKIIINSPIRFNVYDCQNSIQIVS